jgi:DNA-binding response OmpR family regulator
MTAKRVLIVEDDEYLLRASEIALRRAGYVVMTAPGGAEGLNLARVSTPDLIVLDLLMPRPTGLDVLRALRAETATRSIPVVVVSNSSMQRIVEEVQSLGAEYVTKAELSLRDLVGLVEFRLGQNTLAPAAPAPVVSAPAAAPSPVPAAPSPAPVTVSVAAALISADPIETPVPSEEGGREEEFSMDCAGCGFTVRKRFQFCPKCGRQLDRHTSTFRRAR